MHSGKHFFHGRALLRAEVQVRGQIQHMARAGIARVVCGHGHAETLAAFDGRPLLFQAGMVALHIRVRRVGMLGVRGRSVRTLARGVRDTARRQEHQKQTAENR